MFSQVLVEKSLPTPYFGRIDVSWMITIWKIHLSTICIARFSFPRVKLFFLGLLTHSFWACVFFDRILLTIFLTVHFLMYLICWMQHLAVRLWCHHSHGWKIPSPSFSRMSQLDDTGGFHWGWQLRTPNAETFLQFLSSEASSYAKCDIFP